MRKLFKIILIFLALAKSLNGNTQDLNTHCSLHDSLRYYLKYFHDSTTNENIRHITEGALALYSNNMINDSLANKLLNIEDSLLNSTQINHLIITSFAERLKNIFHFLYSMKETDYYVKSVNKLASLYVTSGEYQKALLLYQEALKIQKDISGEESADYATCLDNLGYLYDNMGNFTKALALYNKALEIRRKKVGENNADYINSLDNIAGLYESVGKYKEALLLQQSVLILTKKLFGEENSNYATSLNNLANLYQYMGEYDKSLPLLKKALTIGKEAEDYDYATTLNNLGGLYVRMGEYEEALPLLQKALSISKKIFDDEHPQYILFLNNLASLYKRLGEYENALPLFQRAVLLSKKVFGEEHPQYATILHNLSGVYVNLGDNDEALKLYLQESEIRKSIFGVESVDYAISLNALASLYGNMGNYAKAISYYKRVLLIREKTIGKKHPDYATTLGNLADVYERMNQSDKALSFCSYALSLRKSILGERHPDYAVSLSNLANLYVSKNQYGKALPLYKQATAIGKKVLGQEHPDYINSLTNLGLINTLLQQYKPGIDLLVDGNKSELAHLAETYSSLSEQEKLTYLNKETYQFNYLPSIFIKQRSAEPKAIKQIYDNALSLKGMVMSEQQQVLSNIRRSKDSAAFELYEQWRFNKAFIGKQLLLPISKRLSYLDSLQGVTNQLEEQLSRLSVSFRNQQQSETITPTTVCSKLSNSEAAIEFIKFQLYDKKWTDSIMYAALLLLPGDTIPKFIPLFEERRLQNLLHNSSITELYPSGYSSSQYSSAKRRSLYNLVWQPLEKYLTEINTIYYAPTGLLGRICFNALYYDTAHLLIEKYNLNQILSTRSVALPTYATRPSFISAWGNIQYDFPTNTLQQTQSNTVASSENNANLSAFNFYTSDTRDLRKGTFSKLAGTKLEVDSISTVCMNAGIRITSLSDTLATEESFKALDGNSPQVLHLATHGFFLPVKETKLKPGDILNSSDNAFTVQQNPMFRSGLVLAGGNLAWRGRNIPGKNEDGILTAYEISQMDLSNTDLVVLSACKTALGDISGNEGVIGLQRAFKIAGVKQMILSLWNVPDLQSAEVMTMFYKNWINGQSTREALRSAQLKMKEKYPPYYWAAFVLIE